MWVSNKFPSLHSELSWINARARGSCTLDQPVISLGIAGVTPACEQPTERVRAYVLKGKFWPCTTACTTLTFSFFLDCRFRVVSYRAVLLFLHILYTLPCTYQIFPNLKIISNSNQHHMGQRKSVFTHKKICSIPYSVYRTQTMTTWNISNWIHYVHDFSL